MLKFESAPFAGKKLSVAAAVVCSSLLLGLQGCAWIEEQTGRDTSLGLSPVGAAAATGAVIGGGLGAIVGSNSGSAGGGLVIGAAVGAAAGGLVGEGLENQRKDQEELELKAAQDEELLKANRRRIQEFQQGKDVAEKRASLGNPPAKPGVINTPPGYKGNPRAIKFTESHSESSFGQSDSIVMAHPEPVRPARLAPKLETSPVKLSRTKEVDLIVETPPSPALQPATSDLKASTQKGPDLKGGLPPPRADEELPVTGESFTLSSAVETVQPPARKVTEIKPATELVKAPAPATIDVKPIPPAPVAVEPAGVEPVAVLVPAVKDTKAEDCARAEQEFGRAKNSVSDADKLFYLRRALRLCSGKTNYHLAIGRIYGRLGRVDDAEYEFKQVLDLEPGNSDAKQELTALKQAVN